MVVKIRPRWGQFEVSSAPGGLCGFCRIARVSQQGHKVEFYSPSPHLPTTSKVSDKKGR